MADDLNQTNGFSITYSLNGGTLQSGVANPTTDQTTLPTPLPTCTKSGLGFGGWYVDAEFTKRAVPGATLTQNVTLYARFATKNSVDVATLPGWAALAAGDHLIQLKACADGYIDSDLSESVVVRKLAVYTISNSLTHCISAQSNPTTIVEGTAETLTYTAETGYALPATVTVTGATHTWDQATGTLVLSNPTDNVTVTIVASVIVYNISNTLTNVVADASNPTTITAIGTATLKYTAATYYTLPNTITVTGAQYTWDQPTGTLSLSNATSDVSIVIEGDLIVYDITATLSNVTADAGNPSTIAAGGTATLKYTANQYYKLPDSVTVTGADHTWDKTTGTIVLSNAVGDVAVTVTGELIVYNISTTLTNVTADSSNPTTINAGSTATLKFTANQYYNLPDSVTVTGATSTWNKATGTLTLNNPTADVSVTIAGEIIVYTISNTLTNVTADSGNPTTINAGSTATLKYTANQYYKLPDTVTVTGADHTWDKTTGTIVLSNPTGNVAITVTGEQIVYNIVTTLSNVTGDAENPTTINAGGNATLKFTANQYYKLPADIAISGASSFSWNENTGVLTVTDAQSDVAITITGELIVYTISNTLTHVTGAAGNPTTINAGGTASLTYTADEGYILPETVTVTGATHSWDVETGVLSLSAPTGNVSITIVGALPKLETPTDLTAAGTVVSYTPSQHATSYVVYADGSEIGTDVYAYGIATNLTNVTAGASNPKTIDVGGTATLTFTAATGYGLPETVTVSGATYTWDAATGTLSLSAPSSTVSITIVALEKLPTVTGESMSGSNYTFNAPEGTEKVTVYADNTVLGEVTE